MFLMSPTAEHGRFLGQIAQAAAGPGVHCQQGDVLAIQLNHPPVGRDQADDEVEAGCLAGAVGSQQADNLSRFDSDAYALEHTTVAVALEKPCCLQCRHFGRGRCDFWD
jgi:hypothetical protein